LEAYDPARDRWTRKADMPTERTLAAIAVVDGIIYVIGGNTPVVGAPWVTSVVEAYDPARDRWIRKADMLTARLGLDACVIDGRIYVFGGASGYPETVWPTLSTVEVYDPATDTWTQVSDMPWPRYGHSASLVDGKMYIIGGADPEVARLFEEGKIDLDELAELFETVDVYDPGTDTWTRAARCPFATVHHAAGIVDGTIYTIGGRADAIYSKVYEFDPGLSGNIAITSPAGKLLRTWGEVKSQ
jgi:N-acetylneuraminic acid mutarotase